MSSSQEEFRVHGTFIKVFLEDLLCVTYSSRHWSCNEMYEILYCSNMQITTYPEYTWHLHIEFGKKSRPQDGLSLANNSLIDICGSQFQERGLSQETRRKREIPWVAAFHLSYYQATVLIHHALKIFGKEKQVRELKAGWGSLTGTDQLGFHWVISEAEPERGPRGPGKGRSGGDTQLGARVRGPALLKLESWHQQSKADWEKETDPPSGVLFLPKAKLQAETAWLELKVGNQAFAHGPSEQWKKNELISWSKKIPWNRGDGRDSWAGKCSEYIMVWMILWTSWKRTSYS